MTRLIRLLCLTLFAALAVGGRGYARDGPDLAAAVDPMVGTSGTPVGGPVDTFPGADVPFGMLQWSPDTPSQYAGGGYYYGDSAITGFSLTHTSGPGCSVSGDIGILPTTGAVSDPARARQTFVHTDESASPGWYAVRFAKAGIGVALTTTTRTGLGSFTFPADPHASANLLFNVSSNQAGVADASVRINGNEVSGWARTGNFCGAPDLYTIYFAARFNRPVTAHGTWTPACTNQIASQAAGTGSGAWVSFASDGSPVEVQVAISFVSVAGARANLDAEAKTWNLETVREASVAAWNKMLGRVRVSGGTPSERRVFYTALYHSFLHPNVYSDAGGSYTGFDGAVHRAESDRVEYATLSGWDIYRTEVPLLAILAPQETSDMMESLLHEAQQGGWLPKWPLLNGYTGVMGGDPADIILAGAYAFGARDFDARGALAYMLKGATQSAGAQGQGWYIERPGLDEYLSRGYVVNDHTTNVAPLPNGASLTLEYALADFSIAALAKPLGREDVYRRMLARSGNWENLFDTSLRSIAPRARSGAFMQTPIADNGQSGFQEGNGSQYTWIVPNDLADLSAGMGGDARALANLDRFFTLLNAGQNKPFAWLGNEPSLGIPWDYLSLGAPWKGERVVRDAMLQLYTDAPDGIPGNDDLGTMSAWYAFDAMGLYPQNPAAGYLDLGAPIFSKVSINVPDGALLEIDAPGASDANAYLRGVRVNGGAWPHSWVAFDRFRPLTIQETVSQVPDTAWASAPADRPPSFAAAPPRFPPSTAVRTQLSSAILAMQGGVSTTVTMTLDNARGTRAEIISWRAGGANGITFAPPSGSLTVPAGVQRLAMLHVRVAPSVRTGLYDVPIEARAANGALLENAVLAVRVGDPALAYVANYTDGTVTPIDPRTMAAGPPIAVGSNPGSILVNHALQRAFVANQASASVTVIDTISQSVVATVMAGKGVGNPTLSPDGSTVWVTNTGDNTVQPIDVNTLRPGAAIAVGLQPLGLAISHDGATVYVSDQGSNDVESIDVATRALHKTTVPAGLRPTALLLALDGRTLYVGDQGSAQVLPIDTASGKAGTPLFAGVDPGGLAISPDGATLYVTNAAGNTVTPVDLRAGRTRAPITVGLNPVWLDLSKDGRQLFVVDLGDNDCSVVDTASGHVIAKIPVGLAPLGIDGVR